MKKYLPFICDEKEYDLSHLNSFRVTYLQQQTKNQPERIYHCLIEFSSHCFTKGMGSDGKIVQSLLYEDSKEDRLFCFDRYNKSFQLPFIFKHEIFKRKCFFTSASDKFLSIELISDEGITLNYEIYFSLKKSNKKGVDIHIFINSAYIRTKNKNGEVRHKPISFFVLLHNTIIGKRIKKPK